MWIVVVCPDEPNAHAYGPFDEEMTAVQFADFASAEIDPARVLHLGSPAKTLLHWREHVVKGGKS